jgi:hypothetical protein
LNQTTEEVEVFRREMPKFAIQYEVTSKRSADIPVMADYNELSVVSEEFLDGAFTTVFEDIAVGHYGTAVYAVVNEDQPFTVDFRVTVEFVIPGEVPTIQFLIDRVREAFEQDVAIQNYIFDLNQMSETNPFSETVSISLVDNVEGGNINNGAVSGGPIKPPKVSDTSTKPEKSSMLITLLAGIGSFVVVTVGVLWARNKGYLRRDDHLEKSAGDLIDEETEQYIDSVRKRYKDDDGFKDELTSQSGDDNDYRTSLRLISQQNASIFNTTNGSMNGIHGDALELDLARSHEEEKQEEQSPPDFNYLAHELNASGIEDDLRF